MKSIRDFKRYSSLILIIVFLIGAFSLKAAIHYPNPTSHKYLNDYAGVLDNNSSKQIIALGNELERQTGAQAVIVTINSLEGTPIEDYANGLFRKWGIGQASKDNGLLILLAVQDQAWRVEVGRGLEGRLPDALTNRVMVELGRDYFVAGEYGQGLAKIYSVFCDEIATEYGVTLNHSLHVMLPTQNVASRQQRSNLPYFLIIGLLAIDLLFNRGRLIGFVGQMIFWSSLYGGNRNKRGGPGGGGGFGGFGGGSSNGGGSSGGW